MGTVLCKSNANDNRRISRCIGDIEQDFTLSERYIVRAIVLFLGEISCRFAIHRFLPAIYHFCFAIYHSSIAIYRFCFLIYHFCFAIYRFCLKRCCSSLLSRHCEIHVHFPKIIYDNDESSSLRSQLFEMASGELNAFNVS